jgi:hypothetical protein
VTWPAPPITTKVSLMSWTCQVMYLKHYSDSFTLSLTLGTKLSAQTRQEWGLQGMTPAAVETLETQKTRALSLLRSKTTPLEKYIFLGQMRNSNTRLFYKLVNDQFEVSKAGGQRRGLMLLTTFIPLGDCTHHLYPYCRWSLCWILKHLPLPCSSR